jgi:hypothetical protein
MNASLVENIFFQRLQLVRKSDRVCLEWENVNMDYWLRTDAYLWVDWKEF